MIHQQLQNQNRLCVQDQSLPELITSWDEMCLWENIEFIIYLATSSASTAFILFKNFIVIMISLDKCKWSKNCGKNLCKCKKWDLNPIHCWRWIIRSRFEISLLVEWWLRPTRQPFRTLLNGLNGFLRHAGAEPRGGKPNKTLGSKP